MKLLESEATPMLVSNSAAAVAEQAVSGYCCQPKTNAGQLS